MRSAKLAALDYELPAEVLSDQQLASDLGLDAGAVEAWSRGRARHVAPDGEGPADLAARAAKRLLDERALAPTDLDLILFATNTPDYTFPGSACVLQGVLEASPVGCLDMRAHCAGFVAALDVASRFVATGDADRVLVAAGDVPSHMVRLDGRDPELACLTGDGAAVALIEAGDGSGTILATHHATDGRLYDQFWCEAPASRRGWGEGVARGMRLTHDDVAKGLIYPTVDLRALRETALLRAPEAFARVLDASALERVDAVLIAHLDPETENELAERLSDRAGRVLRPDLAYSMAATLPTALARAAGTLPAGDTVALVTAGSGASWGAAVVRW